MPKIEKIKLNTVNQKSSDYLKRLFFTSKHIINDKILSTNKFKEKLLDREWFYYKDLKSGKFYKNSKLLCSCYWLSQMDIAINKIYKNYIDKYIVSVGYNEEYSDCQIGFSGTGEANESSISCALREMAEETGLEPKNNKNLKEIHSVERSRKISYYTIDIKDLKISKNIPKKNVKKIKQKKKPLKIVVFIIGSKEEIYKKLVKLSLIKNEDKISYLSAIPVTHVNKIADITKKRSTYYYQNNMRNVPFHYQIENERPI